MADDLYETDFYTWTERQGELLRSGLVAEADLVNIAEEIETLGRSEAAALRSAYRLIAMHLLKMTYQPKKMSKQLARHHRQGTRQRRRSTQAKPRSQAATSSHLRGGVREGQRRWQPRKRSSRSRPSQDAPPFDLEKVEAKDYFPQSFHRWQAKRDQSVTRHAGGGIAE